MSHTDKTRPWYVQVADPNNYGWAKEDHDHRNGICDLAPLSITELHHRRSRFGWWRNQECGWTYTSEAYRTNRLWRRMPRKGGWDRPRREGRSRMELRRLKAKWLRAADREDVDSRELLPTRAWLNYKWRD